MQISVEDAKNLLLLCGENYNHDLNAFAETSPTAVAMLVRTCFKNAVVGHDLENKLLLAWHMIKTAMNDGKAEYRMPSHGD